MSECYYCDEFELGDRDGGNIPCAKCKRTIPNNEGEYIGLTVYNGTNQEWVGRMVHAFHMDEDSVCSHCGATYRYFYYPCNDPNARADTHTYALESEPVEIKRVEVEQLHDTPRCINGHMLTAFGTCTACKEE